MEDVVNSSIKETEQLFKNVPQSEREKLHTVLENSNRVERYKKSTYRTCC
jgi:hypothetical protein